MTRAKGMLMTGGAAMLGVMLCLSWADAKTARKPAAAPPKAVASGPTCDMQAHPKITKVTPDTVKPGQRITIKGSKFGTKECFQNVSFGRIDTKEFKYVNDSTVEVTVPNLKPGLVPVNLLTAGGSAQFMVLVQK